MMNWPWKRRSEPSPEVEMNEAAVAYVQAGVQSAVTDLNRSLSLLENTFKALTPPEKKKVATHA